MPTKSKKSRYDRAFDQLKGLGLNKEFFHRLVEENDWAFVLKANALAEAVAVHAICTKWGEKAREHAKWLSHG